MERARTCGRPAQVTIERIERAGRDCGLTGLTIHGVAATLGVTPAALYRHVDGRVGLERLVGESILAELAIVDRAHEDAVEHLMTFATGLRRFALGHPGLPAYLQVRFPRGASGIRLLRAEVEALTQRGYLPNGAAFVASTVAGLAISQVATQEQQAEAAVSAEIAGCVQPFGTPTPADPCVNLPELDHDEHFRVVMSACIRGILDAVPPERRVPEIIAALSTGTPEQ